MLGRWLARHGWEITVGLGLTVAAIVVHLAGLAEPFEWVGFDLNVRHFSRTPASEKIVHIDIGDDALDRVGSWPWPRDLQADLLRILKELGAAQIITDIVWSEPKPPEVRLPGLHRFADLEGMQDQVGEASVENVVFPDDELASAIAQAGNVYLAMYYETANARAEESPDERRITELLRGSFELTAPTIARQTEIPRERIDAILAGIKRRAAEERVTSLLEQNPAASFEDVHRAILSTPLSRETADRADVLAAYHRVLGLRELRDGCPPVPPGLQGRLPKANRVIPPIYKLTAGARRVGFVTFKPDPDGRTRHVPLLLEWNGRLLEHLAFAAARDALGIAVEDLSIDAAGFLNIKGRAGQPDRRIQLDAAGQLLINWHVARDDWPNCFQHRPVTLLLQLTDCRRRIEENDRLRQWHLANVIRLTRDATGFDLYRKQVRQMLEIQRKARWAVLQGRADTQEVGDWTTEADRLSRMLQRDQNDAVTLVKEEWADLRQQPRPTDHEGAGEYDRFHQAHRIIEEDLADLEQTNVKIAAQAERFQAQLRPLIENKICFVGYTATAVADMVTTPPYRHVPGVLVHSNVLNSFLGGEFLTWSTPTVQAAVIAFFGLLVTVVATTRGPWGALVFVVIVTISSFLLSGLGLFGRMDYWLRLMSAMLLAFLAWVLIALLRYLTTEREKRRFSRAVAQYVSPAMARRLADQSENLDLSPSDGYVSCFFSDLVGFTPISERLGPEGTKTILNPYLESMSVALHRHQALINKFMGDGIFAFFNPPILPCADHEAAACASALDSRRALLELKRRYAGHPLAGEFDLLEMRIGIASGPVFVGDYGSENKLDYTCVGDTVNLAARLEAANKILGTRIMVTDSSRRAAGERFLYRRLGPILVQGRTAPVEVYELLGQHGEVDDEVIRFAEVFERAVAAFVAHDWIAAAGLFLQCLRIRPDDPGCTCYLRTIEAFRQTTPPDNIAPCLEVTVK
ncbi:MAG TPA: CHASE2 domain-containing protein [Phycisphaerae bacterium]|nr:CHASE2 domain-containing protein [Phycisphaerae bacterium]